MQVFEWIHVSSQAVGPTGGRTARACEHLCTATRGLPVHVRYKAVSLLGLVVQGAVVGFSGCTVYCLCDGALTAVDICLTPLVHQSVEAGDFSLALQVRRHSSLCLWV